MKRIYWELIRNIDRIDDIVMAAAAHFRVGLRQFRYRIEMQARSK